MKDRNHALVGAGTATLIAIHERHGLQIIRAARRATRLAGQRSPTKEPRAKQSLADPRFLATVLATLLSSDPQARNWVKSELYDFPVSKKLTLALVTTLGFTAPLGAQELVSPERIPSVNRLMDRGAQQNSMKCGFHHWRPFLGLDLSYHAGFGISCRFRQFAVGDALVTLIRVMPQGGAPVLLADSFKIPPVPRGVAASVAAKSDVNITGGFAVGLGRYTVELLALDQRGRNFYKRWTFEAGAHSKQAGASALAPFTVKPLFGDNWDGKLDPKGVRLTVLLDATAPSVTAAKLHEAFLLLQLLASLLRQVPCQSVTVVAFNLDQQREVFRQEHFDAAGFASLSRTLRQVQFSTISYQALQRRSWAKFLLRITKEQISASNPADAVVFIGASTHFVEKLPKELRESLAPGPSHFFYFEYYGYRVPLPDAIDYLTRNLKGTVFRINSAQEFGKAIKKMLTQLGAKQTPESAETR